MNTAGFAKTQVKRHKLRAMLDGPDLRGRMLVFRWPRITRKFIRNASGERVPVLEPGEQRELRAVLHNDWSQPTAAFQPAGGIMFNVETEARAREIQRRHDLFLVQSVEGVSHPFRLANHPEERDHPCNVPLDRVEEIIDTLTRTRYVVQG